MDAEDAADDESDKVAVRFRQRHAAPVFDDGARAQAPLRAHLVAGAIDEAEVPFLEVEHGGVASPHTGKTLSYVAELKRKHGIDYDCHANYRFMEKSDAQ